MRTTKNIVKFPKETLFPPQDANLKGAILRFPYFGLQVKSHIHPKFIICQISQGIQDVPQVMKHPLTKAYQEGPYTSTFQALLICQEIYIQWMIIGDKRREQEEKWQEQRRWERERMASTSTWSHSYNTRSQSSASSGTTQGPTQGYW